MEKLFFTAYEYWVEPKLAIIWKRMDELSSREIPKSNFIFEYGSKASLIGRN